MPKHVCGDDTIYFPVSNSITLHSISIPKGNVYLKVEHKDYQKDTTIYVNDQKEIYLRVGFLNDFGENDIYIIATDSSKFYYRAPRI